MKKYIRVLLDLIAVVLIFNTSTYSQIRLPLLISDGMVLQRGARLNIWGWASPGEQVSVKFKNKKYRAVTSAEGKWSVSLSPSRAGGPYTMELDAGNHIVIKDILIGDVWFCSGQSNMVLNMERVKEKYASAIASASYPRIRNFFVPTASDVTRVHDDLPGGRWVAADPQTVLNFGAAAWFFARKIYDKYKVPIGIINSSVGGTPAQAWVSVEGLRKNDKYNARLKQLGDTAYLGRLIVETNQRIALAAMPVAETDKGLIESAKWYDSAYTPVNWRPYWLPGYWADQGIRGLNGVVWFRKEITVPASMSGRTATLNMGRIVDADYVYVNGVMVGSTSYQYPPRRYVLPPDLLKEGKNIIVVRVINTSGKGGFVPDKPYCLCTGADTLDLRGDWQYKVGKVFYPAAQPGSSNFSAQNEPSGLYNTMVAPVVNYKVKGVLWYQGEANTFIPSEYRQLLPELIADWRMKWKWPDMPFIYAQLPGFMEMQYAPSESQWAELREAQLKSLAVANTGMAVTIDAGEWNDIHPLNKRDVGERLALAAERVAYGDTSLVSSGPLYLSDSIEGNKIVIRFSNTGSGLVAKGGGELSMFAIAGKDKKFVWARAEINDNRIMVWSDEIKEPLYVRYAWADNPDEANLFNKEGLPASPFRTDGQ